MDYNMLIRAAASGSSDAASTLAKNLFSENEAVRETVHGLLESEKNGKLYYSVYCAARFENYPFAAILPLLESAAEMGSLDAKATLGTYYFDGTELPQNYEKAVPLLEAALRQNNGENSIVLRRLAECYLYGLGCAKNEDAAIRLLQRAVNAGDADATKLLRTIGQPVEVSPNVVKEQKEQKHSITLDLDGLHNAIVFLRYKHVNRLFAFAACVLIVAGIIGWIILINSGYSYDEMQHSYTLARALMGDVFQGMPFSERISAMLCIFHRRLLMYGGISAIVSYIIK